MKKPKLAAHVVLILSGMLFLTACSSSPEPVVLNNAQDALDLIQEVDLTCIEPEVFESEGLSGVVSSNLMCWPDNNGDSTPISIKVHESSTDNQSQLSSMCEDHGFPGDPVLLIGENWYAHDGRGEEALANLQKVIGGELVETSKLCE